MMQGHGAVRPATWSSEITVRVPPRCVPARSVRQNLRMDKFPGQGRHRVRFDWAGQGASAVTVDADVAVVVDVLSFTTTLTVALDRGTVVLPYRWNDDGAADYARQHDAVLAVGRSAATAGQISLSPGTVRNASSPTRLVLLSPNGSTIAHDLAETGITCVGASLRNASAVAEWISRHHDPATATVAVIAAGERWPDGSLRPAVEDLWGAGALITATLTCPSAVSGAGRDEPQRLRRDPPGHVLIDSVDDLARNESLEVTCATQLAPGRRAAVRRVSRRPPRGRALCR